MKVFLAFFLVMVAAFVGYHLSFRRVAAGRSAAGWFPLTGLEFLVIGLLLGPMFFNVLDPQTSRSLEPLSALVLGWIGMLLGFQFEITTLRKFPPYYFAAMLIESGAAIVITMACLYLLLPLFVDIGPTPRLITAMALSAAAACTAQSGLALVEAGKARAHAGLLRLLRYLAGLDGLLPMFLLVLIYFIKPHPSGGVFSGTLQFLAVLTAVLLIYALFLIQRRAGDELAMVVIGMTVLASGAAMISGFSPLVANFLIGCCLVNATLEKEKIFALLVSVEKPVYLILLIFAGAQWHIEGAGILLPALVYCLIRTAAKSAGGYAAVKSLALLDRFPRGLGLGLLEQGGLPIAILFDFQQRFSGQSIGYAVGFALAGIVAADLLSRFSLGLLFRKAAA